MRVEAMKKRSSTGGKAAKARPRKVLRLKGRNFPKPPRSSSSADELMRVTRERDDSLQQQTATSDVLQVISRSPGDLQPVFETILENAVRICDAKFGNIYRWDGNALSLVATHNTPRAYAEARRRSPVRPNPNNIFGSMVATKTVVHILDAAKQREQGNLEYVAAVELGGVRTCIAVPMLKQNELIGSISLFRQEVCPFTDKQIALITNFAAQAVIAIENARLLNELRESLQEQTATAEVLKTISSSPGHLEPVFAAMLEKAASICDAAFGNIYRWDGDALHLVGIHNTPPALAKARERSPIRVNPRTPVGRMLATKETVHIADLAAESVYTEERDPIIVAGVELGGIRTLLLVPMLKENQPIGVFSLYRQEVRPFIDKQIALVENFAAQAVIAVENARLLSDLRQSLEQQTATSEVLQVISSSPGDLQPVFESLLRNATQLCKAKFGTLYLREEAGVRLVAAYDMPAKFYEVQSRAATEPAPGGPLDGALKTKRAVQIPDLAATESYRQRHPRTVDAVELGHIRTAVAVPMLKDDEPIGVISIHRPELALFDEKIALLTSFAAQAVIAIENARLLNELRQRTDDLSQRTTDLTEALEQQTATSEVLKVISSSPGDVQPVFATMLENAVRICDAKFGGAYRQEGDGLRHVTPHNAPAAFVEKLKLSGPAFTSALGRRMMASRSAIQVADLAADQDYVERRSPRVVAAVELGGVRTILAVPMLKENELVGALMLARQEVRPFTDKQIALVQNFAAQAVIAIENTRLLNELRERTSQLEVQSQEVVDLNQQLEQRVADQVGEIERMGRLRRFLPPQVADLIVASGTEKQLESHRREITALFCDLRGFTGFSESSDPEDVMALLREYHVAIGEIIVRYSGTLERYAGDG
jgi:GAF domain-containing protein